MSKEKINADQILIPVAVISLVVMIFLGFQTTLLVSERAGLHAARDQQDKPLQQVSKVKDQASALALGTLKLAQGGNKDAEEIIALMKKAGVEISPPPPGTEPGPAPDALAAPAAK